MWNSVEEFDAWTEEMEHQDYPKFLLSQLSLKDAELRLTARANVSFALGNPVSMMVSDRKYATFLADYVDQILSPLVAEWAAVVLAYAQVTGRSCGHVLHSFFREAEKMKTAIMPDPETAELIFGDARRRWNLFLAVSAVLALLMKKDRAIARLQGFRRSLWGTWKHRPT